MECMGHNWKRTSENTKVCKNCGQKRRWKRFSAPPGDIGVWYEWQRISEESYIFRLAEEKRKEIKEKKDERNRQEYYDLRTIQRNKKISEEREFLNKLAQEKMKENKERRSNEEYTKKDTGIIPKGLKYPFLIIIILLSLIGILYFIGIIR